MLVVQKFVGIPQRLRGEDTSKYRSEYLQLKV
ncbi:Uncharacterised protein [Legionella geestiana]|nr:Uncharacterised protein [Legionella geestiana]